MYIFSNHCTHVHNQLMVDIHHCTQAHHNTDQCTCTLGRDCQKPCAAHKIVQCVNTSTCTCTCTCTCIQCTRTCIQCTRTCIHVHVHVYNVYNVHVRVYNVYVQCTRTCIQCTRTCIQCICTCVLKCFHRAPCSLLSRKRYICNTVSTLHVHVVEYRGNDQMESPWSQGNAVSSIQVHVHVHVWSVTCPDTFAASYISIAVKGTGNVVQLHAHVHVPAS